jgi:hypothetical protein
MANQYISGFTQTWNSGGTTFYAIKVNVTDAASASDSMLLSLQISGAAKFMVSKNGDATLTNSDAGAAAGPVMTLRRDSATPAASDVIGKVLFQGEDSAGNTEDYAEVYSQIDDATSTSEDASLLLRAKTAGAMTTLMYLRSSVLGAQAEGDIFYRDATGLARLAKGSAGQFLRQNAGLTAPEWSSGWETIGIDTLSAVASWSRTDLGAFRKLKITGWARPATDGVSAWILTSTNNGSSYDTGAANYSYSGVYQSTATVAAIAGDTNVGDLNLSSTIGNDTHEGIQINISIDQFNQSARMWSIVETYYISGSSVLIRNYHSIVRNSATARNALQFTFSSGNIAAGHIVLEGIRG